MIMKQLELMKSLKQLIDHNKDLKSLDRKVLNKYCPKFREKYGNQSIADDEYDDPPLRPDEM